MKARSAYPVINSLSHKMTFGKYKGETVEFVIGCDPGYILWLEDEKVAKFSEEILNYAEESNLDQRLDDRMDMWDYGGDG